jgi:hypothetical protein
MKCLLEMAHLSWPCAGIANTILDVSASSRPYKELMYPFPKILKQVIHMTIRSLNLVLIRCAQLSGPHVELNSIFAFLLQC